MKSWTPKTTCRKSRTPIELGEIDGRVAFDNVTFRYFEHGENVLKDISFIAEPGQTIALLGSTGSGKSTIINLIPRFYDVSDGAVKVDGHDVRDVTINSLREQIGIVLQETTLVRRHHSRQHRLRPSDASDEEVIAAAQAAAAHEFIMAFPEGYDTAVGERGSTLSGGQKQRVAIARALLMDPHILILDDSTSSVDLNTEYEIQKALDKLMDGRTSFVIAQRISTVLNADQITGPRKRPCRRHRRARRPHGKQRHLRRNLPFPTGGRCGTRLMADCRISDFGFGEGKYGSRCDLKT